MDEASLNIREVSIKFTFQAGRKARCKGLERVPIIISIGDNRNNSSQR